MPRIKFIRDVPNESGDGLLYAEGYEVDVSHAVASKWVTQRGDAVDLNAPASKTETHEMAQTPPKGMGRSRPARRSLGLRNTALDEADLETKGDDE